MNTPTHLILGAAVFARPGAWRISLAAILGAFVPDLSLYLMAAWHLLILDTSPHTVFRELYYSDRWQAIFAVDNSFILWGAGLCLGLWLRKPVLIAFAGAGFLHLLFDFPLHNHDARQHFWPLTNWVFESPFSYWDDRHYGNYVKPLENMFSLILLVILWRRFAQFWPRIAIIATACLQLFPSLMWAFVFGR